MPPGQILPRTYWPETSPRLTSQSSNRANPANLNCPRTLVSVAGVNKPCTCWIGWFGRKCLRVTASPGLSEPQDARPVLLDLPNTGVNAQLRCNNIYVSYLYLEYQGLTHSGPSTSQTCQGQIRSNQTKRSRSDVIKTRRSSTWRQKHSLPQSSRSTSNSRLSWDGHRSSPHIAKQPPRTQRQRS